MSQTLKLMFEQKKKNLHKNVHEIGSACHCVQSPNSPESSTALSLIKPLTDLGLLRCDKKKLCCYIHSGHCSNWSLNISSFFRAAAVSNVWTNKQAMCGFGYSRSLLIFQTFPLTTAFTFTLRVVTLGCHCLYVYFSLISDINSKQLDSPSVLHACSAGRYVLFSVLKSYALCTMLCVPVFVHACVFTVQYMFCLTTIRLISQTLHIHLFFANKPSAVMKRTLPLYCLYSTGSDVKMM